MENSVRNLVSRIDRRKLTNNTQRVLLSLLAADGQWVSRTSLRVKSASSRIRDLRTSDFGGFVVECAQPTEIGRRTRRVGQTFYRLVPTSVTLRKVAQVFEGVVGTH